MIMPSTVRLPKTPQLRKLKFRSRKWPIALPAIEIGLLTGCQDRPYAFGLAMALVAKGVGVDVIGGDEIDSPELHVTPNLRFLNFRGDQHAEGRLRRNCRIWRLLRAVDAVCGSLHAEIAAHFVEQQDRVV